MEPTKQTKGSSLQQALASLTEDSQRILWSAVGLERRLVGYLETPIVEAPGAQPEIETKLNVEPPLLTSIEEQIRHVLGQIREAGEILLSIERELS